jgi:hypothetical protein
MAPDPRDTPYTYETEVSTRLELLARSVLDPQARSELCNRYAPVVFTFYQNFLAGRPNARSDALELTHGFLIHFFLEQLADGQFRFANYLSIPVGERGRFLAYALRAAANFRLDRHEHETNQEHGGGWTRVEVDADPDRFAAFIAARQLPPDEQVELAYTLSLLWQAAVRVRHRIDARPAEPLDQAFHDALAAGAEPRLAAIAAAHKVTAGFVRARWEAFRADRALAPFLLNPPPPYAGLAAALGTTAAALATRFTRLRTPLRLELQRIMADELGLENPVAAAAEVTRLLDVLGQMAANPDCA